MVSTSANRPGAKSTGPVAPLITVLWVLGMANAVNLIDGLDGLGDSLFFFLEILTPTWAPPAGRWEKHPPGATKTPAAARKAKDRARRKATKKGKAKKK